MKGIINIFWNSAETRPRALWRILLHILLTLLLFIPFGSVLALLEAVNVSPAIIENGGYAVQAITITIAIWLAARWFDKRELRDFGLRISPSWWRQLAFGLLLGALLMAGVFLAELALGYVTIVDTFYAVEPRSSFAVAMIQPVVVFLAVGFYEELLSRGYHLRNMAEGLNFGRISPKAAILLALVLSSAIFGALHAGNPNATTVSTINIMLAGILLGAGLVLLDELAIPIGLHITWNFFQGNVFGFPVSGTSTFGGSFIRIKQEGPEWLTGGAFGPEAGVIGLVAMIIGLLAIAGYAKWETGSAEIVETIAMYPPATKPDKSDLAEKLVPE